MPKAIWLLPCVLMTVSACATVGQDYVRPAIDMPDTWRGRPAITGSDAEAVLQQWWTTFNDPWLDRLVERAVKSNLDIQIAAARIREARALGGIAAAAALPQVDASFSSGRIGRSEAVPPFKDGDEGSPFGPRQQNLFDVGFDASWEIDVFGGVRRDKEAALAEAQANEESMRDVLVTLLADVARRYVELRATQQQLLVVEETIRSQEDTLGLVRARFEAGLATDLDVARAEGLVASTRARGSALNRLASESIHRLGVLLGQAPNALESELGTAAPIPTGPPELPATLPSELLTRRPDLRRAERELAAATARVGVARAELFPRFAILGSFGRRSEAFGDLGSLTSQFWTILPGIRWPILSGGRIRANIRAQSAREEQAAHAYEQSILLALRDVADALVAHDRERERQASLEASLAASRRALAMSAERYRSGLESFLSVLDAQRTVYEAEDALVRSERDRALSMIALYKSLGGGWRPEGTAHQAVATKEEEP